MFKDPLHQEETPYDLLGLDPDVPHGEVLHALPRFMKDSKKRSNIPKAQEAVRRLMNSKDRLTVDILYYCIGELRAKSDADDNFKAELQEFMKVPLLNDDEFFSDLKKRDFSEDFREIIFNNVEISELNRYDDLHHFKLEMIFDK